MQGNMSRNLVVVIDALDECYDGNVVGLLLDSLFSLVGRLPIKFFITSRPEPAIYDKLASQVDNIRSVLHLHEVSKNSVRQDIEMYLEEGLKPIQPSREEVERLTALSGQLFIYAATVVRYIIPENASVDSRARLKTMLDLNSTSTRKHSDIDALYIAILSSAVDNKALEPNERDNILSVVWAVVCSDHPVPLPGLALIAGLGSEEAASPALAPLRSVLHISANNCLISTFHASFPQFILDQSRSNKFCCNPATIRQRSALRCLQLVNEQPPCEILPDAHISPCLNYAIFKWISHLADGDCPNDAIREALYIQLRRFFEERFESWEWVSRYLNYRPEFDPVTKRIGLRKFLRNRLREISSNDNNIPVLKRWLEKVGGPADLVRATHNAHVFMISNEEERQSLRNRAMKNHLQLHNGSTDMASYRSWIWGEEATIPPRKGIPSKLVGGKK
ncbi:hypothetical protein FRC11_011738 [Ceratobasidium sp. 423]|nr:hypothetical protein FRC11_011738 [Ceratobasidium sp. 423]